MEHTTRHEERAQHGVDIHGYPAHLNGNELAAAQCKNVSALDIAAVEAECEEARYFDPTPREYLVVTTARRDAALLEDVRRLCGRFPFLVHIMFWDDVIGELVGHQDLLAKHYPHLVTKRTTAEDVRQLLMTSTNRDFAYHDGLEARYVCLRDIALELVCPEDESEFSEPWVKRFPDPVAYKQVVEIRYGGTLIETMYCAHVDGCRFLLPYPKPVFRGQVERRLENAVLIYDAFRYRLALILNRDEDETERVAVRPADSVPAASAART